MEHDRELVDRVRRIETRVTKIGRHFGIDVGGGRPIWDPRGRVVIPSPNCSVGDILKTVPDASRSGEVDVYVGDEYMMTLYIDP